PPVGSGVDSPLPTQEAPAQPADRNTQGGESAVLDKLRHVVRDVIGDSADSASAGDLLSIVEQLAQIVAIVTPRTRAALSARSQFKDTLRLRQTLIRASENNPLKISVSDEEALRRMLTSSEPGMLGGVDAVNQALGELAAHQSALVAALKPALGATLRSLSPEAIEKKSGGAKSERLPMINRRGKLWEEYSSMYKELAESDGRALEQKFLLALAKHYETALTSFES
ncbi:MAG: type VI secretion system FHA domain protein, partial [Halieaceae bacterium]